jgi:Holliday junction resolvasome RuvABC ATP-dependent DNA helicase subunit
MTIQEQLIKYKEYLLARSLSQNYHNVIRIWLNYLQTKQDYQALVEPFLLQQGYISRTARGRIITNKGKTLLKGLK